MDRLTRIAIVLGLVATCTSSVWAESGVLVSTAKGNAVAMPDRVSIQMDIRRHGDDVTAATLACEAAFDSLAVALKKFGVAESGIITTRFRTQERTRYNRDLSANAIVGVTAVQSIKFEIDAVAEAGQVVQSALVGGATHLSAVGFRSTRYEELADKALAVAVRRVRDKAIIMALQAGVVLGDLLELSNQIQENRAVVCDLGESPTVPITIKPDSIRVTVQVTGKWQMQPQAIGE